MTSQYEFYAAEEAAVRALPAPHEGSCQRGEGASGQPHGASGVRTGMV